MGGSTWLCKRGKNSVVGRSLFKCDSRTWCWQTAWPDTADTVESCAANLCSVVPAVAIYSFLNCVFFFKRTYKRPRDKWLIALFQWRESLPAPAAYTVYDSVEGFFACRVRATEVCEDGGYRRSCRLLSSFGWFWCKINRSKGIFPQKRVHF